MKIIKNISKENVQVIALQSSNRKKKYYPMPMKHIQLHPFITHRLDYIPLCFSKLPLHDAKEIWN